MPDIHNCFPYAGLFHAPANRTVHPYRSKPGEETVEILLNGGVWFSPNRETPEQEYRRGSIFWHVGGEFTICRSLPNEPYVCLALRFRMGNVPTLRPCRVSEWPASEDLDGFVSECLRDAHDERIDPVYFTEYLVHRLRWLVYLGKRQRLRSGLPEPLLLIQEMLLQPGQLHLTVRDLAQRAKISEAHLYALFRKHLETSPHHYLLQRKLRMARIRLAGSSDSIKAIAQDCGFENLESFYRAFRRSSGLAPGEYRRQQQSPGGNE